MTGEVDRPGRAPVSASSEVCRRPGRPYTEVDDHSLVLVPEQRTFVEIAPGALALWGALDGRPLAEVLAGLTASPQDRLSPGEAIEVVRRWRALGLVEERTVLEAEPETASSLLLDDAGGGARGHLAPLDPDAAPPPEPDLTWRAPGPDTPPIPPTEGDAAAWFAALLGWVSDDDLLHPGLADALAGLAEQPDARACVGRSFVRIVADAESWTP